MLTRIRRLKCVRTLIALYTEPTFVAGPEGGGLVRRNGGLLFHNVERIIINNLARVVRHAQHVSGLRVEKSGAKTEAEGFTVRGPARFERRAAPERARARLAEQRDAIGVGLVRFEPQTHDDLNGVGRNRDASRLTCPSQLRRDDERRDSACARRGRFLISGLSHYASLLGGSSLFGETLSVVLCLPLRRRLTRFTRSFTRRLRVALQRPTPGRN